MHHQPKQLSGGQEQRVAIARAIVTDPDLILADEPTGNLDARSGEEVMQILSTLNHELNKTIMLVTHDPHAASFASEQLHLEKGRIDGAHSGHGFFDPLTMEQVRKGGLPPLIPSQRGQATLPDLFQVDLEHPSTAIQLRCSLASSCVRAHTLKFEFPQFSRVISRHIACHWNPYP